MKFSALVLRNIRLGVSSVGYAAVADALLAGGVPLDEIVLAAYDDPSAVLSALNRLKSGCGGVFLICDGALSAPAREAMESVFGPMSEEGLFGKEGCLGAVLTADEAGVRTAGELVVPAVNERRGESYYRVVLKTVGAPAERVLSAVETVRELSDKLLIDTSEEYGVGRIEIVYRSSTPKIVVDEATRILASGLEKHLYAMEDVSVAERLVEALKLHRMKISTAESFTGGGVGRAIVSVAGASKVFYEGLNTYDRESKKERLGVTDFTLRTKGAVSGETAYEMAAGLLTGGHCDVAVSTTGVAGPGPDETHNPAGLCFIGVGTQERIRVFEHHLTGGREEVIRRAVALALFHALGEINR